MPVRSARTTSSCGTSNNYEETKNLAEADVRMHTSAGMPATIYRPAIVLLGPVPTGETRDKFDGPDFVMQRPLLQPGARSCQWRVTRR